MVGCVQAVVNENRLLVQFKYGQEKEMIFFACVFMFKIGGRDG